MGIIVLLVVGVMALLTLSKYQLMQEKRPEYERHLQVVAELRAIRAQLERFKNRTGVYPTTEQGLSVLGGVPQDPWRSEYVYRYPDMLHRDRYDLFSAGRDRKPDTADDDRGSD